MSTRRTLSVLTIVAILLAATGPIASAQGPQQGQAEIFADQQLIRLSAWKYKATREALEEKQGEYGDTAAFNTAWGILLAAEGDLDQAVTTLNQAANKDNSDPAPDYYRGQVLYWQKKYDAAKSAWNRSSNRAKNQLKNAPNDARANFYAGAALTGLKQCAAARPHLQKALNRGFDGPMVNYQLGMTNIWDQNWQAAKDSFDKVIEADSRYAYAYYYRGLAWDKLNKKANMLVDMDQFVKLAPKAPDAGKAKAILAAAGG